jgi:hypothetical protein
LTSALATAPRTPLAPGFAEILIVIIIIVRATGFAEIIIIIRVATGFAEVMIMIMRGRGWWC